jgi:hypothetical protein
VAGRDGTGCAKLTGMYVEPRPTCVTVIGWVWIVLGGMACVTSALALPAMASSMAPGDGGAVLFPAIAAVQLLIGAVGLISGIHFLKLKPWSRSVLEALTWVFVLLAAGSSAIPLVLSVRGGAPMAAGEAVIIAVIALTYVVPLGIMLRYLRGAKVRSVFRVG